MTLKKRLGVLGFSAFLSTAYFNPVFAQSSQQAGNPPIESVHADTTIKASETTVADKTKTVTTNTSATSKSPVAVSQVKDDKSGHEDKATDKKVVTGNDNDANFTATPLLSPANGQAAMYYQQSWDVGKQHPETLADAVKQLNDNNISYILISQEHPSTAVLHLKDGSVYNIIFNEKYLSEAHDAMIPLVYMPKVETAFDFDWLNVHSISSALGIFLQALMCGIVLIGCVFMFKKMSGSKHKRIDEHNNGGITFKDVAGMGVAKQELQEIVDFLKNPSSYSKIGAQIPRGVLLEGPPGTGKTLLAKAVAGESNLPFYSLNGPEIIDMFVGVGAGRIGKVFNMARKRRKKSLIKAKKVQDAIISGGIIFIDEVDAIAGKRGGRVGSDASSEREHILLKLLTELDGINNPKSNESPIILICATNRAALLDPAFLRPGRVDRKISVPLPDKNERAEILRLHAQKYAVADGIDYDELSSLIPGFSGADIAGLLNEAAMEATRKGLDCIDMKSIEVSIDRVRMGSPRPNLCMSKEQKYLTCVHEAGHALAAALLPEADRPVRATTVPHGDALGFVMMEAPGDEYIISRARMVSMAMVMLAGRAAEIEIFGLEQATSGAENDRARIIALICDLVGKFGLSDKARYVGSVRSSGQDGVRLFSEEALSAYDKAVEEEYEQIEKMASDFMSTNRSALLRLARGLYERPSLNAAEIKALIESEEAGVIVSGMATITYNDIAAS